MAKNSIVKKSFWDSRVNLNNRPSVSYRTAEVIETVMTEFELPMGKAIEKLIYDENLYAEIMKKLKENFPDIDEME